jgi:putative hydrolase
MSWTERRYLNVDIHVHTVASGHAFGTVGELVSIADERGMSVLGISDHGPSMAGAPHEGYFTMASDIHRWGGSPKILLGCEANIIDCQGRLDLAQDTLRKLDYVMAGLHGRTPYDVVANTLSNNTQAVLACLEAYAPDVLTHPLNPAFPIDLSLVVPTAARLGVALEINSRILWNASTFQLAEHERFLKFAAGEGASLILSSDAHIPSLVGDMTAFLSLGGALNEVSGQIINTDGERFSCWLQNRRAMHQLKVM